MKQNKWKVVGVTGGIGSGKSLVLNILQEYKGVVICKADEVARELQKKGNPCYEAILTLFGEEILAPSGEIDRKKLGEIVFSDTHALQQLNQAVHPLVKEQIIVQMQKLDNEVKVFVIEAALLIEDDYQSLCDELWYVYADDENRYTRVRKSREMTRENFDKVKSNQLSHENFLKECDVVIHNNGTIGMLELNVKNAYKKLVGEIHENM